MLKYIVIFLLYSSLTTVFADLPKIPTPRDLEILSLTQRLTHKGPVILGGNPSPLLVPAVEHAESEVLLELLKTNQNLPKEVLVAYQANRLNLEEMSTLLMFCSAMKQFVHEPRFYQIGERPGPPSLLELEPGEDFLTSAKFISSNHPELTRFLGLHLLKSKPNAEEIFRKRMRTHSKFEQLALVVPILGSDLRDWSGLYPQLISILGFFKRFVLNEQFDGIIIPSLSMLKEALKLHSFNESESPEIKVVFGTHTPDDIHHGNATNRHILNLQHPSMSDLVMADGVYAGPWGFTFHDYYHLLRIARIALKDRMAMVHAQSLISAFAPQFILPPVPAPETKVFVRTKKNTQTEEIEIQEIHRRLMDLEFYDSRAGDKFGLIFSFLHGGLKLPKQIRNLIIRDMILNNWDENLNVGRADLYPSDQEVYDRIWKAEKQGDRGAQGRIALSEKVDQLILRNQDIELAQLFDQYPTAVDFIDGESSPLMSAAMHGCVSCVHEILKRTHRVDQRNQYGSTALMFAAFSGQDEIVHALLQAGANPLLQDLRGYTSVHYAASQEEETALIEILSSPKNITQALNTRDKQLGLTPLMMAVKAGYDGHVAEMLRFDQDLKIVNHSGRDVKGMAFDIGYDRLGIRIFTSSTRQR